MDEGVEPGSARPPGGDQTVSASSIALKLTG